MISKINKCPLCGATKLKTVEIVNYDEIFSALSQRWDINISRQTQLENKIADNVELIECCSCHFQYFKGLPTGNKNFYKERCNYAGDKWEYDALLEHLNAPSDIIDIGAGNGNFMNKAKKKGHNVWGLEMNPDAITLCKKRGLNVSDKDIYEFNRDNRSNYSAVVSFHVIEHVKDPVKFFKRMISMCKKGGVIALAVPNNKCGHVRSLTEDPLNYPPHHVTRWFPENLVLLAETCGVKLKSITFADHYNCDSIRKDLIYRLFRSKHGCNCLRNLIYWFLKPIVNRLTIGLMKKMNFQINYGTSMIAFFEK